MNSTAFARPRLAAARVAVEPDMVGLAVTAAVVALLALLTWDTWGDVGRDLGYDWVAGARVAHGHLPYVDFIYYYGPLAPFALGLGALIGGASVSTFLALGLVITYAIVGLTYVLARTQTNSIGATIAAVATAAIAFSPTNLSYVAPHTSSATLAILFSLAFLVGLARGARGARRWLILAGVSAGMVSLTRPEFELAVVTAAVVWGCATIRNGGRRGHILAVAVPLVAIPVVVYGAFLTVVTPHRLLFDNLYPVAALRAGGNAIARGQAPLTAHSFLVVGAYLSLYGVGVVALLLAARVLDRVRRGTAWIVVGVAGSAILTVAAWDPEAARSRLAWVFGGVPAAALIGATYLLIRVVVTRHQADASVLTLLCTLVLLTVVAAKTYSGFFFLAYRAQYAVYVAPFVFIALTRLHLRDLARRRSALAAGTVWLVVLTAICLGLTVKDARARSVTVTGPGGSLRVSSAEAPLYRAALGAIASGSEVDEPILIAPQLTALYTLSKRIDPLPEISLVPGALARHGAESAVIRVLSREHVRLAVIDRHRFSEYDQSSFGKSFDRRLARWIHRTFVHVATLRPDPGVSHTLEIWMRRPS